MDTYVDGIIIYNDHEPEDTTLRNAEHIPWKFITGYHRYVQVEFGTDYATFEEAICQPCA